MTNSPIGPTVTPFLMFSGNAEKALKLYVDLFENSKVMDITHYGANEDGAEGTIKHATISLNGQKIMCIDSPVKHDFTFTPATSLYVACPDENRITQYFNTLSKDGQIFMPLNEYPFSKKFAWIEDRFGVSWQLTAS